MQAHHVSCDRVKELLASFRQKDPHFTSESTQNTLLQDQDQWTRKSRLVNQIQEVNHISAIKNGRGGISGGNILDNESKHGNIHWKYLLRDFSVKLMVPDEVKAGLKDADTCGLVTSNHVSNRTNGAWANRTCKDCKQKGHSSGQFKCGKKSENAKTSEEIEKDKHEKARAKRKWEEMCAIDNE